MKRKAFALALSLIMLLTCAACGDSGGQADDSAAQSAPAEAPPASQQSTDAPDAGDKVTIQLWNYFPEAFIGFFESQLDDFNASQDRIEVVSTFVSREDLMKQYALGSVSGELPDIGMTDSPDTATYIEMGIFEDITELADTWGELDAFLPGPLSSCRDGEGKLYGLPQNTNCLGFIYNKTILEAAGFSEPPQTWDDVKTMCEAITQQGVYGIGVVAPSTENATFQFIPWLYSAGGGIEQVNSEAGVRALSFITELYQAGHISPEAINWTQTDLAESFIAGNTAMMLSGSWNIPTITSAGVDFEWGVCEIPMDQQHASVIGGENLSVCVGTEHKEEAFEALSYLMSAQVNADYAEVAGRFPVRSDAMELKDVWTNAESDYSIFANIMEYAVARGPSPNWTSISEAVYTNIQASLLNEKTPEQALNDAAVTIEPLL